jgi:peptide/nickel transport system permease protein
MFTYIVRRVVQSIPVILGVVFIGFILQHLLPGGPAQAILGPKATPQKIQALDHLMGLDKPLLVQFWDWLDNLIHLNFGYSYIQNLPVSELIAQNLPHTLELIGLSLIFSFILAVPVAVYQATRRNTLGDYILTTVNLFLYAMPGFWLGTLLIIFFAIDLHWFPVGGISSLNVAPGWPQIWSQLYHMFLPALVLSIGSVAGWSQYLRSSILDVVTQDFVRTARAKGLSPSVVMYKHIMRNALIPVITLFGLSLPALVSGAVIIEDVFNYPGMGLLYFNSATQYDFPTLLALLVIVSAFTVIGNLVADLLYGMVDPRVRYD